MTQPASSAVCFKIYSLNYLAADHEDLPIVKEAICQAHFPGTPELFVILQYSNAMVTEKRTCRQ
jgi:hypothetical protein